MKQKKKGKGSAVRSGGIDRTKSQIQKLAPLWLLCVCVCGSTCTCMPVCVHACMQRKYYACQCVRSCIHVVACVRFREKTGDGQGSRQLSVHMDPGW